MSMEQFWVVAGGGAAGAYCRYKIGQYANVWFGKGFPYGTMIANVLGCFLMGLVYGLIQKHFMSAWPWHDLIAEGFLGALTTFSTFSYDTYSAFYEGKFNKGILNLILSLVFCLFAAYVGYYWAV